MITEILVRRGRTRRADVKRDAQGRIPAEAYRDDPTTLPGWNRLRGIAEELALDPRLTTQRGKLFYQKQITVAEFEALNRWADMLEGYDILILGKRRHPPSPAIERIGFSSAAGSIAEDLERIDRFKASHTAAHQALLSAGKIAETAVNRICRDEGAGAFLNDALRGTRALAEHFGLVKGKRG